MFKRLAPVLELPESRSESNSPTHKRSQTHHKTRFSNSPQNSDSQVWMIIQSRRNLDKKIRNITRKGNKKHGDSGKVSVCSTVESPCSRNLIDFQEIKYKFSEMEKNKIDRNSTNRLKKEKNNENKEKIIEKAIKARADVKMQSAIDNQYMKKREEILLEQKKERVNFIKNSLRASKHKRNSSNSTLKEINNSDFNSKIQKINEFNKTAENSLKKLQMQEEILIEKLKFTTEHKENLMKALPDRSLSVLISPRRTSFFK